MGQAKTLTVTLETVTPLFLGGANPRDAPELRAASMRGALRYWLRAASGGAIGDSNLAGLHALEEAVFGSTARASPIAVQWLEVEGHSLSVTPEYILPHQQLARRKAYTQGQLLMLRLRSIRGDDDTAWNMACAAVGLATTFGGVGLRARRGYGTLRVMAADPPIISATPSTLDRWKTHIAEVSSQALACAEALARAQAVPVASLPAGPAAYPCATGKGIIRITELNPPVNSAMKAVVAFMKRVPVHRALGGITLRQASPLWVRPIQVEQRYELLLSVLASRFPGADYAKVREVLDQFPGQDMMVKGWNL